MTNTDVPAGANDNVRHPAPEAGSMVVAWRAETDGENAIRMQLIDDGASAASLIPRIFDISDGQGYKYDPFVAKDISAAGWGVAWLESAAPHAPAQVKFTFVDPLGATTEEVTVHDETAASGHAVHQHDVVLSGFGAADPGDPHNVLIDGINVVWVSTDLDPGNTATTVTPYGRIMLQRYEIPLTGSGDPAAPRPSGLGSACDWDGVLATANDNSPVQLGFGRNPSATVLKNGETAITWIDQNEQLQGVFIADDADFDTHALTTKVRNLSSLGLDQSRLGVKYAQVIGIGIGNLLVAQAVQQTDMITQLAELVVYAQLISVAGGNFSAQPIERLQTIPAAASDVRVQVTADDEGFILAWNAPDEAGNAAHVMAQHYSAMTPLQAWMPSIGKIGAAFAVTEGESDGAAMANGGTHVTGTSGLVDIAQHLHGDTLPLLARPSDTGAPGPPEGGDAHLKPDATGFHPQPPIVSIVTAPDGSTNVFGQAFDGFGRPAPGERVQLSDGDGIVADPTVDVGHFGYMAVWEERAQADMPSDLKARYYNFGNSEAGIAPGLVGQEFTVYHGTPNTNEHDAVVSDYESRDARDHKIEVGFHVAYVATDRDAPDQDFGAVEVARFEIPVDPQTGEQGAPLAVKHDGTPVDLLGDPQNGIAPDAPDAHVTTLATSGRDPSAAVLSDGEYVVTWIDETGQVQGTMLAPTTAESGDGEPATTYTPVSLDLSDICGSDAVAANQVQQVASLGDGSFVLVWIADNDHGGYEIVGKLFTSTGDGHWTPSETKVFVDDVHTSDHDQRIEFKISLGDDDAGNFVITYTSAEGDQGTQVDVAFDGSHENAGGQLPVAVVDATGALGGDTLVFKPEYSDSTHSGDTAHNGDATQGDDALNGGSTPQTGEPPVEDHSGSGNLADHTQDQQIVADGTLSTEPDIDNLHRDTHDANDLWFT